MPKAQRKPIRCQGTSRGKCPDQAEFIPVHSRHTRCPKCAAKARVLKAAVNIRHFRKAAKAAAERERKAQRKIKLKPQPKEKPAADVVPDHTPKTGAKMVDLMKRLAL